MPFASWCFLDKSFVQNDEWSDKFIVTFDVHANEFIISRYPLKMSKTYTLQ